MKFKIEVLKSKNYIVHHSDYRFREDWLLQAHKLGIKKALDFIDFIDKNYENKVKILRESYICPTRQVYIGIAGLKLEFLDKKSAEHYCEILNKVESNV